MHQHNLDKTKRDFSEAKILTKKNVLPRITSINTISDFSVRNSVLTGLNISTGHWIMSSKKSSYVRRKALHIGHSCPAWS